MKMRDPKTLTRPDKAGALAPFSGDGFDREELASRLTAYIDRLKHGAVIAIDAPWGAGKSWFGRNWAKSLEATHRVVYIDAFESDYIEDPFVLIASEIANALDDGKGAGKILREKAAGVVKAFLPVIPKTVFNTAGRLFLGSTNLSDDIKGAIEAAGEAGSDAAGKWIEARLDCYNQEKASLARYRTEIQRCAEVQEKPVVFFIDELDRCQPLFAIRLLERVKHFFDVPNVVFVLLLNRQQLECAVHGVYGASTDASAYLTKFVQFFLTLPPPKGTSAGDSEQLRQFIGQLLIDHGAEFGSQKNQSFMVDLAAVAVSISERLTLREIERAITLYLLAAEPPATGAVVFLIVLKLRYPSLFAGVAERKHAEIDKARALLSDWISNHPQGRDGWPAEYFEALREVLLLYRNDSGWEGERQLDLSRKQELHSAVCGRSNTRLSQVLVDIARRLDVGIS